MELYLKHTLDLEHYREWSISDHNLIGYVPTLSIILGDVVDRPCFGSSSTSRLAYDEKRDLCFVLVPYKRQVLVVSPRQNLSDHSVLEAVWDVPPAAMRWDESRFFRSMVYDNHNDRLLLASREFLQAWSYDGKGRFTMLLSVRHAEPMGHTAKLAIDYDRELLLVSEWYTALVLVLSLQTFYKIEQFSSVVVSSENEKFPVGVGEMAVGQNRVVLLSSISKRTQVLSCKDYTCLYWIKEQPMNDGNHDTVCVDNLGRIILGDVHKGRLEAYDDNNSCVGVLNTWGCPISIVYDRLRGRPIILTKNTIKIVPSNRWLPNSYIWTPTRHCYAPKNIKVVVTTIAMLRSLSPCDNVLGQIPNELLFEIFSWL